MLFSLLGAASGADAARRGAERRRAAAQYEAAQLRSQGGQVFAASQRGAREANRQARLVQSRALAVAAASGGGVSDPTVVNMLSRTAGEGAYRAAVALYEGEERARTLRMQAAARDYEGQLAIEAGEDQAAAYGTQALGSLFKGAVSMYDKYGGSGPASVGLMAGDNPWEMY